MYFTIQFVCLAISPVFFSAGLYFTISNLYAQMFNDPKYQGLHRRKEEFASQTFILRHHLLHSWSDCDHHPIMWGSKWSGCLAQREIHQNSYKHNCTNPHHNFVYFWTFSKFPCRLQELQFKDLVISFSPLRLFFYGNVRVVIARPKGFLHLFRKL